MLLTGEPGSGKTSAIRHFASSLSPQNYVCYYTPLATVSKSDLYRHLNHLLTLPSCIYKTKLFEQIQTAILDTYENKGKIPCILLDEVQLMNSDTLQELVLISNFKMDSKLPFILVIAGQPELKERLKRRLHEPLAQRISFKYHMSGLSLENTREFIKHHLKIAGRQDPVFEEGAYEIIQNLSHGLPRRIGNTCLAAMTLAMMKGLKTVDPDTILKSESGL